MGSKGEYSDRVEWPVAVYTDEAMANTHCQLADSRANELFRWRDEHGKTLWSSQSENKPRNEYDPDCDIYYETPTYWVHPAPLLSEVPKPVQS
jgi:hypothetical protein